MDSMHKKANFTASDPASKEIHIFKKRDRVKLLSLFYYRLEWVQLSKNRIHRQRKLIKTANADGLKPTQNPAPSKKKYETKSKAATEAQPFEIKSVEDKNPLERSLDRSIENEETGIPFIVPELSTKDDESELECKPELRFNSVWACA